MPEIPGDRSRADGPENTGTPDSHGQHDANADSAFRQVVARYDGTDFGDLDHALAEYGSAMRWATRTVEDVKQQVSEVLLQEPDMSPWEFVSLALGGRPSVGSVLFNQPDTDRALARRGLRSMIKGLCFAGDLDRALRCADEIVDVQIRQSCTLQVAHTMAKNGRLADAVEVVDRLSDSVDPQLYVILGALDAIATRDPNAVDMIVSVRNSVFGRQLESGLVRAAIDDAMPAGTLGVFPPFRYLTNGYVAQLSKQRMFRWYGMTADADRLKVMVYAHPLYDDVRHPLLHNIGIGAGLNCNEQLALTVMDETLPDDQYVFLRGFQYGLARSLYRIGRLRSPGSAQ